MIIIQIFGLPPETALSGQIVVIPGKLSCEERVFCSAFIPCFFQALYTVSGGRDFPEWELTVSK